MTEAIEKTLQEYQRHLRRSRELFYQYCAFIEAKDEASANSLDKERSQVSFDLRMALRKLDEALVAHAS